MKLEPERNSSTLKWLVEYITKEIDTNRKKNDGDLTELETAKLRGRVQALRTLQETLKPFI